MKHLIFLFALLIAAPAWGQAPDVIPDDYEKAFRRFERKQDRLIRRSADTLVWLDPIESFPIEPTFYALETGNWGGTYLGINQRSEEIRTRAKRNVVVFIFDTAGEYENPFLKDYAWNDLGKVFTGEDSPDDGHGHSTHVAGIIAARAPDYPLGVARMVPIKLVPVKVLSNKGSGSFQGIVAGTQYANTKAKELTSKGWFVIYNYSLGGGSSYAPLEEAFKEAEAMGVLINVAANGNSGGTPISYPGNSIYTLGTAALQQSGSGVTRASYSSYGPETWGSAPGSSILSTWPGGGTKILSGTSMATPHQAGVFAILASVYPTATAAQLKAHYIKYATDLGSPGRDEYYGYGAGVINALLDNAPDGTQPPPPPDKPTCDDGKQNGDETGIDCGGSCPPCEPGDNRPPYRARVLPVILDGSWSIDWWRKTTASEKPEVYDLDAVALVNPAGKKVIHIKEIGFLVSSESEYTWEAETLRKTVNGSLRNTGIGTSDQDAYDAGRWIPLIVEYFGNTKPGLIPQQLKPIHLKIVVDGVEIIFNPEDLKDWEKQ